jgi:hypothetical protein
MVGGAGGTTVETVIVNGASEALPVPLLTEIVMPGSCPASVDAGVPVSAPVVVLKVAQLGLPVIENVSVPPPGFVVVGVNE